MIKCEGLVKEFDNELKIEYSDIAFEDKHSYLLLGQSGCGKSTLLNMISGLMLPSEGRIEIDGQAMTELSPKTRDAYRITNIGYIYQDYKLLESMTVEDNIRILEMVHSLDRQAIDSSLKSMGILDRKNTVVGKLSGGQKQRVAISRALVKNPKILLADEPTGNLNYEIGHKVMEDLISLSKDGILIVVSHDERLADLFTDVIRLDKISRTMLLESTTR